MKTIKRIRKYINRRNKMKRELISLYKIGENNRRINQVLTSIGMKY